MVNFLEYNPDLFEFSLLPYVARPPALPCLRHYVLPFRVVCSYACERLSESWPLYGGLLDT